MTWKPELCQSVLIPLEAPDVPRPVVRDAAGEIAVPRDAQVDEEEIRREVSEEMERLYGGPSAPDVPNDSSGGVVAPAPGLYGSPPPITFEMEDVSARPPRPVGLKRSVGPSEPVEAKKRRDGFVFTPGCPSCESGMNAPGIRHSAKCKRNQEPEIEKPEVFAPGAMPSNLGGGSVPMDGSDQAEEFRGSKRASETELEKLEEEIKSEVEPEIRTLDSIGLCWLDTGEPLMGLTLHDVGSLATSATGPEMFHVDVTSIKFEAGLTHVSEKIWLCGTEVRLWKPTEAVDDATLTPLNPALTYEGMKEEVNNMTKWKVGKVLLEPEVGELRKSCKGLRVIPARWVTAFKTESRVRARVVAKDVRSKQSARELGFSSPTPSTEALHLVLAIAATRGWRLRALDVSHAFMHSPLPDSMRVILKMPQSISSLEGHVVM